MITIVSLFLPAALSASDLQPGDAWVCDVELIIRINSRKGRFGQSEEKPELSYLLDANGVAPYMHNGELIFNPGSYLDMNCSKFSNGSTLCVGDSTFGQSMITDRFELRPDMTFFMHQVGATSKESGAGWAAVDRITLGRCSTRE